MIRSSEPAQDLTEITESCGEDQALMLRIAAKDRQAFAEFYQAYSPRIGKFSMVVLKSKDLVDEVLNDVMLTVWQQAHRYDPNQGKLSSWLFGIAHNKCLKILEQNKRHRRDQDIAALTVYDSDVESDDAVVHAALVDINNPESVTMGWETGEILVWALQQLSFEHKTVIELTFIEHCSYQEIAKITDCPVNTVKTRVFHARKKLAEFLNQRGVSLGD